MAERSRAVGQRAENRALAFLQDRGLCCLTRNFRSRFGEIDLIMQDQTCIVFVEVRSRTASSFVSAVATVDEKKQRKLWSTALFYLAKNPEAARAPCRFDVVGVNGNGSLDWVQDAFRR